MFGLLAEALLILLSVCVTQQIHLLTLQSELCQHPANVADSQASLLARPLPTQTSSVPKSYTLHGEGGDWNGKKAREGRRGKKVETVYGRRCVNQSPAS